MSGLTIQLNGYDRIVALSHKFPEAAAKYVQKAIVESFTEVQRDQAPWVPVDTGRLKSSFRPAYAPFQGTFGTNVPYAGYVHDMYPIGMPYKNPSKNKNAMAGFLYDAVNQANPKIQEAFEKAVQRILEEISR